MLHQADAECQYDPTVHTVLRAGWHRRSRLAAYWLATGSAALLLAAAAEASCPIEQTARCAGLVERVHGHRYRVSGIRISLNGKPSCAYAKRLIRTWLRSPRDRIYDSSVRSEWFKVANRPLTFTAGLCGSLSFRI